MRGLQPVALSGELVALEPRNRRVPDGSLRDTAVSSIPDTG
ncbi:hypothetical protein SAMN05428965_3014 [Geodermatophilus sp. DSM 45219]|nr:hypothetical protein SAMN05428965_3014 [Geodermatophilus sp. DSM 45219]